MAFELRTTLREMFTDALLSTNETWSDVIAQHIEIEEGEENRCVNPDKSARLSQGPFCDNNKYGDDTTLGSIPKDEWLDLTFNKDYGASCPINVILWTKNNIHFNYEYDGYDFVITKPRNPPNEGTN